MWELEELKKQFDQERRRMREPHERDVDEAREWKRDMRGRLRDCVEQLTQQLEDHNPLGSTAGEGQDHLPISSSGTQSAITHSRVEDATIEDKTTASQDSHPPGTSLSEQSVQ